MCNETETIENNLEKKEDENNEDTLMLSTNTDIEDIEEWLGKLGL